MLTSAFCHQNSATFVISENVDIDCTFIHNLWLFNFFESLKVVLIITVAILMISAKLATLNLLKIKVYVSKGYDVTIL